MSPAKLKAWSQAKDRVDTPTAPPAQAPAPARPAEPSGEPGWLVVSLGSWPRPWRWWLDWPCSSAARRAVRTARFGHST